MESRQTADSAREGAQSLEQIERELRFIRHLMVRVLPDGELLLEQYRKENFGAPRG